MSRNKKGISLLILCALFTTFFPSAIAQAARDTQEYVTWESYKPPTWETVQFYTSELLPIPDPVPASFLREQIRAAIPESRGLIRIANPLQELLCGQYHRLTLVVDAKEYVSVSWYSSNPKIAEIDYQTGKVTALASGKTNIFVVDESGRVLEGFVLTVVAKPDFYEVSEECYEVKGIYEDTVALTLKEDFSEQVQGKTCLKFPDTIDGKKVNSIGRLYEWLKGKKITALQLPSHYLHGSREWQIEELYFYEGAEMLCECYLNSLKRIYLPESMVCISDEIHSDFLREVRIPASVMELGSNRGMEDEIGIWSGERLYFCVDGSNTHYYSLFGVLYAHSFRGYYLSEEYISWDYIYTQSGARMLMHYPVRKREACYYVPEGIERIGDMAFANAKYLQRVVLPSTLKEIGEEAFIGCKALEEIVIPASVKEIGEDAFSYMSYIRNPDLTIVTPKGSAAEAYAIEHGIRYRNE